MKAAAPVPWEDGVQLVRDRGAEVVCPGGAWVGFVPASGVAHICLGVVCPFSRVVGEDSHGLGSWKLCPVSWHKIVCTAALWLSSASRGAAWRSRPSPAPAVLPCLSVCRLLGGSNCTPLQKHLVLDNLWIIANSRYRFP